MFRATVAALAGREKTKNATQDRKKVSFWHTKFGVESFPKERHKNVILFSHRVALEPPPLKERFRKRQTFSLTQNLAKEIISIFCVCLRVGIDRFAPSSVRR